jgi:hypothetical protein
MGKPRQAGHRSGCNQRRIRGLYAEIAQRANESALMALFVYHDDPYIPAMMTVRLAMRHYMHPLTRSRTFMHSSDHRQTRFNTVCHA